jgi:type IX secretion system PorP/SprF family membrane protein
MLLMAALQGGAQDLHFSQYYNSPLTNNPANTGFIPDGNYRIGINYRDQWATIPVPYKTMSAFGDFQLFRDRMEYGWLGLGGEILRDVAGSGNLTSTKVYGSIAYHQLLGQSSLLSLGFNVGEASKRVDVNKLTFGDQWNGQFFDAQVPTAEPFAATKVGYFDMQVGMNYAYFPTDNIYINVGASVQHINHPRETFYNDNNVVSRRFIGFLDASLKVSDKVIFNPSGYYTRQANSQETMIGGNLAYNLVDGGNTQLYGGIYYRFKDAAIFAVGYQLSSVKIMFSYDATVSTLTQANGTRGAYEIGIVYTGLYPNKAFNAAKRSAICPHF